MNRKMKHLLRLIFILSTLTSSAQDTLITFLDHNFRKVESESAFYKRTVIQYNDKLSILDRTMDNLVAGYHEYKPGEQLVMHGYSEYYFNPGVVYSAGHYQDGMMHGEWKYFLGPNSDSLLVVNYDLAKTYIENSNCRRVNRKAKFASCRTGIVEIEIIKSIKSYIEKNIIIPGLFIPAYFHSRYRLDLVIDTNGVILCPTFITDGIIDLDIAIEILRILATYHASDKPAHNLKLSVVFEIKNKNYPIALDSLDSYAQFPGGNGALMNFIQTNLKYPTEARDSLIQGTVYISFIVGVNGKLSDFEVVKKVHPALDDEAIRVLQLSPSWNPTIKDGHPVEWRYNIPIGFKIYDASKMKN